jgi:RNA-directed DNA polymerase
MSKAKPFCISKQEVWEAYKRVKANKGAAGVDEQSIAGFEKRLKRNLYKIWNRMSSGSYFPPPVRTVKIPKANGGERKLGIPTVSDRIAQMVVKSRLEPEVDPLFHPDSYGYRPGKSALDAVGQARQRCWRHDWIVDLDIKGFFDNIEPKSADAGGEEARKGKVGRSLYRALAASANTRGGRSADPARAGHSARWSGQSPVSQSVLALCL